MKPSLLAFCLLLTPILSAEEYRGWPKAIRDIPYEDDVTVQIQGFSIRYFIPEDPERQMGGGSGGPIGQIDVTNQKSKKTVSFDFQTVGGRILELFHGFPQFEIWSRAGGGSYCRSLFRFQNGAFHDVRIDDFTSFPGHATDKSITTTLTLSDEPLYFVGTRYPDTK